MIIFYFTTTGNCLDVAKRFDAERFSIPVVMKNKQSREFTADKIGLIFPCYYMGTPVIVKEFITSVSLKTDYLFAVITYGNFSFGAVNHFSAAASAAGLTLSYLNELRMIDNYLPLFDITKQYEKEKDKNIEGNLSVIRKDIETGRVFIKKKNFLKRFISGKAHSMYLKSIGSIDNTFSVDTNCNECGICAKVCPAENISCGPKPVYSHRCWECLACINNCPQNAIHDKREKSNVRFRNRNVSLNEIIAASGGRV